MDIIGGTSQFLSLFPGLISDVWAEAGFQISMLVLAFLMHVPFRNFLEGRPLLEGWLKKLGMSFAYALILTIIGGMFGMLWMSMILGCG